MRVSQNKAILAYLRKGNSITPLTALNRFSCFRLSARIGVVYLPKAEYRP